MLTVTIIMKVAIGVELKQESILHVFLVKGILQPNSVKYGEFKNFSAASNILYLSRVNLSSEHSE